MNTQECPNTPKCPIFSGVLQGTQYTETYKSLYCLAGDEGRNKCRRYQISQKVGKCPTSVLPNSGKTADEIIAEMRAKGELN
jgi:hypothetical protein